MWEMKRLESRVYNLGLMILGASRPYHSEPRGPRKQVSSVLTQTPNLIVRCHRGKDIVLTELDLPACRLLHHVPKKLLCPGTLVARGDSAAGFVAGLQ